MAGSSINVTGPEVVAAITALAGVVWYVLKRVLDAYLGSVTKGHKAICENLEEQTKTLANLNLAHKDWTEHVDKVHHHQVYLLQQLCEKQGITNGWHKSDPEVIDKGEDEHGTDKGNKS